MNQQQEWLKSVKKILSECYENKVLDIYGSGNQTRTFCYITDAMTGLFKVLLNGIPGEAYNIGNPTPEITMKDLVDRISTVLGKDVHYKVIEYPSDYPSNEPKRRCPSIQKAKTYLGFEPIVELNEGLRRFLYWTEQTYTGS